jgi:hypothetical protein
MTTTGVTGGNVIPLVQKAYSKGERRRAQKLIKQTRPRQMDIDREPNGRRSRRKTYQPPEPSWLAPALKRIYAMHPTVALETRGAITSDQCRAAHSWVADRMASALPYTAPSSLDLDRVRSPWGDTPDDMRGIDANRRYNDLHNILTQRCGVFGRDLAFRTIIQGEQDEAVAQYWHRIGARMDPTPRQITSWQHLAMAFVEIENFYALQVRRKMKDQAAA